MSMVPVKWPVIKRTALHNDASLLKLANWYAVRQIIPEGFAGQLLVFEAAENAIAKGRSNPCGLFVARLWDWKHPKLFPIGERIRDRAHVRLKHAVGMVEAGDPERFERDPLEEDHLCQ